MAEKIFNGRIVQKHDTAENWSKATSFVPKQGEVIVYDKDSNYNYERIKVGDGSTLVSALPFVGDAEAHVLAENTDLNTIITDGVYGVSSSSAADTCTNNPLSGTGFILQVYTISQIVYQEISGLTSGGIYKRRYNIDSNDWNSWVQMARTTDNVSSATKLKTGRTLKVDLESTEPSSAFNGTKSISNIGVSGTLPIANGGTGATTAEGVLANLGVTATSTELNHVGGVTSNIQTQINNISSLVGDTTVSEQIEAAQMVYVGPTQPTDENIKVWINTSEEGTGVIPVLPRIATITLSAASWIGSAEPYSQQVEIATVTTATKVDLQPTAQQIVNLQNEEISLMIENNGGVVTCYAIGNKPTVDYIMQVLLQEVSYV